MICHVGCLQQWGLLNNLHKAFHRLLMLNFRNILKYESVKGFKLVGWCGTWPNCDVGSHMLDVSSLMDKDWKAVMSAVALCPWGNLSR